MVRDILNALLQRQLNKSSNSCGNEVIKCHPTSYAGTACGTLPGGGMLLATAGIVAMAVYEKQKPGL